MRRPHDLDGPTARGKLLNERAPLLTAERTKLTASEFVAQQEPLCPSSSAFTGAAEVQAKPRRFRAQLSKRIGSSP